MLSFSNIAFAAFSALIAICFLIFLGLSLSIVQNKLGRKPLFKPSLFMHAIVGLSLTISLYAIVMTGAKTILILVPIMVVLLLYKKHKGKSAISPPSLSSALLGGKEPLQLLVSWLVLVVFYTYTLVSFDSIELKFIGGDFGIYYRMANYLNVHAVETYNFNLIEQAKANIPSPYHFGDLWFYALIQRVVSANPSLLFLSAFTTLGVIFTLGVFQFFQRVQSKFTFGLLLIIALSGLYAGIELAFPSFLRRFCEPYTLSAFNWGKILLLAVYVVAVLTSLHKYNFRLASGLMGIAALMYINAAPAIFVAAFLLFLYLWLIRHKLSMKQWFSLNLRYGLWAALSVLLVYVGLSKMLSNAIEQPQHDAAFQFLHGQSFAKYLRTAINIFIGGFFQFFTLSPYVLVLLFAMFRCKNSLKAALRSLSVTTIYNVFLCVAGLMSWAVLYPLQVDVVQFFHNIIGVVYIFLIVKMFIYVTYTLKDKLATVLMSGVILLGVFFSAKHIFYAWTFNKKDWAHLDKFTDNNEYTWVNLKAQKEFSYWSIKKTDQYIPLNILNYKWKNYHNISLNALDIPVDTNSLYAFEEKKDIEAATFYTYYQQLKEQNNTLSIEETVNSFIDKYKIGYCCVSKDTVLPAFLRPRVADSLLLEQDLTVVYKLKR